jgi:hypothetical protein
MGPYFKQLMKEHKVHYASGLNSVQLGSLVEKTMSGYKYVVASDFTKFDST